MTEEEWQKCEDPHAMLEALCPGASDRKLCLLSLYCHRQLCPMFSGEVEPYEAYERIDDFGDPMPAVRAAREQHPDYWEFDGTARGFAECITRPSAVGPWRSVAPIVREIFGNPFHPVAVEPRWQTETVVAIATGIYAERAFDRLPILADALEEAGCDNGDVLSHCRGPGPHVRGCWVVDLLLRKE